MKHLMSATTVVFLLFSIVFSSHSFADKEEACGWLQNTADEVFLSTKEGAIRININSDIQLENLHFPETSSHEFVQRTGRYGYFCSCIIAETGLFAQQKYFTKILSSSIKPLKFCLEDPDLMKKYKL